MDALLEMSSSDLVTSDGLRSDEELRAAIRRTGDRELFAQLVHRYERELFSYLRRYMGDAESAEDVFQTTFLQVYLKRDQYEEGRSFRPWLYAVATNQAIDAQRARRRHRMPSLDWAGRGDEGEVGKLVDLLISSADEPGAQLDAGERKVLVREAVDQLPDVLRMAVNLVYYQDLKYREAAEILGVPVGTVKSRLHAAVLKLHELLKAKYDSQV